jgi:hypothetical protein
MEPYTSKILHLYPEDAVYILNGLQAFLTEELHAILNEELEAILTELRAIMMEDYRQT